MNGIVFGSTGKAGLQVIQECLKSGIHITAYTRQNKFPIEHPNLTVFTGMLTDDDDLRQALTDQQWIVSALGSRDYSKPDYIVSDWIGRLIPIAEELSITRVLLVGGAGSLQADEKTLVKDTPSYPKMFIHTINDQERALKLLQASQMEWTLLCCPQIVDGDADGQYALARDYRPENSLWHISTGNIGHFMVNEIENNNYVRSRVGIAATA